MSSTFVVWPIVAALSLASNTYFDSGSPWLIQNNEQVTLVKIYDECLKNDELGAFKPEELKSLASPSVEEVNAFLRDSGFDISLAESTDPYAFYVASILDVLVSWKEKAEASSIYYKEKSYESVRMNDQGAFGFELFELPLKYENSEIKIEVLKVPTKGSDVVYMTIAEKPLEGFALLDRVQELSKALHASAENVPCDEVEFPRVNIDQRVDTRWILGLGRKAKDQQLPWPYVIGQALQQTKFQIDENGAHVKSAFAASFECGSCYDPNPRRIFIINNPFYLWIERDGLSVPVFAAYIDETSWTVPSVRNNTSQNSLPGQREEFFIDEFFSL